MCECGPSRRNRKKSKNFRGSSRYFEYNTVAGCQRSSAALSSSMHACVNQEFVIVIID